MSSTSDQKRIRRIRGSVGSVGAGVGDGDGVGVQTRKSSRLIPGGNVSGAHVQQRTCKYGVGTCSKVLMPSGVDGHGLERALQYMKETPNLRVVWGKTNHDMVNTWWQGHQASAKWSNGIRCDMHRC